MAFELVKGPARYHTWGCLGSAAMVKGGVVRFDLGTGYYEPAVAASAVQYGVCASPSVTASATNGATQVKVIPFQDGQVWRVDTTGDVVLTEIGTIVSLTDAVSIDEDDTGNTPLFKIIGYEGALTDRKALVTPMMPLITAIGV